MILFVDQDNNPLHEVPLQLTAKGCFQFEFDQLLLLLLLEALQLQTSFGLLNEFFPFGSVSDAVLPVSYSHICYITFLDHPPTCV